MENNIHTRLLENSQLLNKALRNHKLEELEPLLKEREQLIKKLPGEKKPDTPKLGESILELEKSNIALFEELIAEKETEITSLTSILKGLHKYKSLISTGKVIDLSK